MGRRRWPADDGGVIVSTAAAFAALTRDEVLVCGAHVVDVRPDGADLVVRRPVLEADLCLHLALPGPDGHLTVVHPSVSVVSVRPVRSGYALDVTFEHLTADDREAVEAHCRAAEDAELALA